jgi:hypothetical protein
MIIAVSGLTEDAQGNKGSSGAGKDEVADHLVRKHGFVKIAFADEIKRICMKLWGFTEEQLWGPSELRNKPDERYPLTLTEEELEEDNRAVYLTPRQALQGIGESVNQVDPLAWTRFAMNVAKKLLVPITEPFTGWLEYTPQEGLTGLFNQTETKGVVISDLRHLTEFNGVLLEGGKCWRKKRNVAILSGAHGKHPSEVGLNDVPDDKFDGIFPDTHLNHLRMLIDSVMDVYTGRIIPYDPAQADVPPFLRK